MLNIRFYCAVITSAIVAVINPSLHASQNANVQKPLPIIDMHAHAVYTSEEKFQEIYKEYRKHNVVKAVISGPWETVELWKSMDVDDRLVAGLLMLDPDMDLGQFENLLKSRKLQVFGELVPLITGLTLSDPVWDPYLKLCDQYDIPVCVHTGKAVMDASFTKARLSLGDPYLIEPVLKKYPNLRVVLCHSGHEWHEHALMLMLSYPRLHSDLAWILWLDANAMRHARDFLRNAKTAGCIDRVLFGTDVGYRAQNAVEKSIVYLNSLDFLTEDEKRDILYNNAVRFLKLDASSGQGSLGKGNSDSTTTDAHSAIVGDGYSKDTYTYHTDME